MILIIEFQTPSCDLTINCNSTAPVNPLNAAPICVQWIFLKIANLVQASDLWWLALVLVALFVCWRIISYFVIYFKITDSKRFGQAP